MKKFSLQFIPLILLLTFTGCHSSHRQSGFRFIQSPQGIELLENEHPVYFYQKQPKSSDGRYICDNYLHPLYSPDGDTLTEVFPVDHPYHRGIFWAWHQIYIGNQSVGDGWVMENVSQNVARLKSDIKDHIARLDLDVEWKSSLYQNGKPFIQEQTTILVHPLSVSIRMIDFEIRLKALVPDVTIGGSDDEKGYGGFCIRLKLPHDLIFTSTNGPVEPQTLQIKAGPWMDFSGYFGKIDSVSGLTILCHPTTPGCPAPWILRRETSMQNIVFPGRQRVSLQMDKPVILRYRVVIHKGSADQIDINSLQEDYNKYSYPYSGPQIK